MMKKCSFAWQRLYVERNSSVTEWRIHLTNARARDVYIAVKTCAIQVQRNVHTHTHTHTTRIEIMYIRIYRYIQMNSFDAHKSGISHSSVPLGSGQIEI